MKASISLFCLLFSVSLVLGNGIEFFKGSWEEALEKAKSEEKLLFVDAYAVWCGPCKMMDRDVFSNEEVGAFFNEHFINVKMDMERGEGLEFRKTNPVKGFPTLMFFDNSGERLKTVLGARRINEFLQLGKSVLASIDRSGQYAEAYESGDRDPELVYQYFSSLKAAGKLEAKMANEYLRSLDKPEDPFQLKTIFELTEEADSYAFSLLSQNRLSIERIVGKDAFAEKVHEACSATRDKGFEYHTEMLFEEANEKMAGNCPERAKAFEAMTVLMQTREGDDRKAEAKALKKYVKYAESEPAHLLKDQAVEWMHRYAEQPDQMANAVDLARMAAEKDGSGQYYVIYAGIAFEAGLYQESEQALVEAETRAQEVNDTKLMSRISAMQKKLKDVQEK